MILWRPRRLMIRAAAPKKHLHFGSTQNHRRPNSDWRSDQKAVGHEWNDRENRCGFRPTVARSVEHLDRAVNDNWSCEKPQQEDEQRCELTCKKPSLSASLSITGLLAGLLICIICTSATITQNKPEAALIAPVIINRTAGLTGSGFRSTFILLLSPVAPASPRSTLPFRP
jgi:hypothetical protein